MFPWDQLYPAISILCLYSELSIDLVSMMTLFPVAVQSLHKDNRRTSDANICISNVLTSVLFLVLGSPGSRQEPD